MATSSKIVESSYRFGCGRYIQEAGAALRIGAELTLLGVQNPFIMSGRISWKLTEDRISRSLKDSGMTYTHYFYEGFCNAAQCGEICASADFMESDCVVGVGGGNIMDAAKLCAAMSKKPVINIPTSSATCAAYTPLSVTYNALGQAMGSLHHVREVNAILVDMDILVTQPERLLISGVYDALAKLIETRQRIDGKRPEEIGIGLETAFHVMHFLTASLEKNLEQACRDLKEGIQSKALYDLVYLAIAVTGLTSSIARGSDQSAIAHRIYEISRTLFPGRVRGYLHGELVALGLLAQLDYNNEEEQVEPFRQRMKSFGMPTHLCEVGIDGTAEVLKMYYKKLLESSAMAGTSDYERRKLRSSLEVMV